MSNRLIAATLLSILGTLAGAAAAAADTTYQFNLPSQSLAQTLRAIGQQTALNILFDPQSVENVDAPALSGNLSAEDALKKVLTGTQLGVQQIALNSVLVAPAKKGAIKTSDAASGGIHLVQAETLQKEGNLSQGTDNKESTDAGAELYDNEKVLLESKAIPEILVKGSRSLNMDIRRSRDSAQPYVVFSDEDIQSSGTSNVEQFLRTRLTSIGGFDSTFSQQPAGAFGSSSSFSLRGLSSAQTLILVDGRRLASTSFSGGAEQPDINSIPISAIERIEILSTTAAGIYGGGATGGVINVIMKRGYSGLDAMLTREQTLDGGAVGNRVDINGGLTFEGGRSSLSFSGSYSDHDELLVKDRDLVQRGRSHIYDNNRAAIAPIAPINGQFSVPPLGATTNIRSATFSSPGVLAPLTLKNGGAAVGSPFTSVQPGYGGVSTDNGTAFVNNAGKYNLDLANTAQSAGGGLQSLYTAPTAKSANITLRREFPSHVDAFLELGAGKNESSARYNGFSGTYTLVASDSANPFNQDIMLTTPMVGTDGVSHVTLDKRRAVGGVVVTVSTNWKISADYTWDRSHYMQSAPNFFIGDAAYTAITTGGIDVFRDTNTSGQDFSPYLLPPVTNGPGYTTLGSAVVRAAGPLGFSLPAGAITLSSSIEYNTEKLDDFLSSMTFPSGTSIISFDNTSFARSSSIKSFHTEITIPIVSGGNAFPGVRLLELQLAGRGDDYEVKSANSGSTPAARVVSRSSFDSVDPTIALRWQPVDSVTLRASAGTGFQPPTLLNLAPQGSYIYGPGQLAFLQDPLRGNEPLGANGNSIVYSYGGNPDLKPESSRSTSVGMVLTPTIIPDFRLSIDWTRIRKRDNIGQLDFTYLSNPAALAVPGFITREAPLNDGYPVGPIIGTNGTPLNFSRLDVAAYDVTGEYRIASDRAGEFIFSLNLTKNVRKDEQILPGSPVVDQLGQLSFPELLGNSGVRWARGAWGFSWLARYMNEYWVNLAHIEDANQGSSKVGSSLLHDMQVSYTIEALSGNASWLSNSEIRLSAINVFNQHPEIDVTNLNIGYSSAADPRLGLYSLSFKKSFSAK